MLGGGSKSPSRRASLANKHQSPSPSARRRVPFLAEHAVVKDANGPGGNKAKGEKVHLSELAQERGELVARHSKLLEESEVFLTRRLKLANQRDDLRKVLFTLPLSLSLSLSLSL